ncbi:MAG: phospholipase D-like domain-containing protein [Prevotella sp.]|nr:phospholipase D-like domain-containing protein [Prevotella sp.]
MEKLIPACAELKFLVGFFYFSGWQEIYHSLKENNKAVLKVLVGLQVDSYLSGIIEYGINEENIILSHEEQFARFMQSLGKAINNADMDTEEFYTQLDFFIQMLQENRLIIKKTQQPNHAKLYLFRLNDESKNLFNLAGELITGSSNLTKAGLQGQEEFNVEIRDYGFEIAEKYFDALWISAIPITEADNGKNAIIDFLRNKSIGTEITPFEAYTYVLKTIVDMQEQNRLGNSIEGLLEENGFTKYKYQLDAVNQAINILNEYNGVIIADVVGLGKSVIASLIASLINKRGLVLCPPGLMGNKKDNTGWWEYVNKFRLYQWDVDSSGNLEAVAESLSKFDYGYEVIIIDEAHRFRNQDTAAYEALMNICIGKKIILLTATPFNNSPSDIFSLLKLFIIPGASGITLEDDLEARFNGYNNEFDNLSYILKNWNSQKLDNRMIAERKYKKLFDKNLPIDLTLVRMRTQEIATEIKDTISPVVIRRNRIDLKTDYEYSKEIAQLSDVKDPEELFYELTPEQSEFYNRVISHCFSVGGMFTGAIYQPALYEQKTKDEEKLTEEENRTFIQQQNLFDFMRRLLVKRFESSFGAFDESIKRFIKVHKMVRSFIQNSGKYVLDRKIIEDIYDEKSDSYTDEAIITALEQFEENAKYKTKPKNTIIYSIDKFYNKDLFLQNIDNDINLFEGIKAEIDRLQLTQNDPKRNVLNAKFNEILTENKHPKKKIIVFTEYVDTVLHLKNYFEKKNNRILFCDGTFNKTFANTLNSDFNAKAEIVSDDYDILITSDKLSEGFNLNRAGAIINYDIPWNPTRVIQRVGRINRMSVKVFDELFIYNIFPTEKGANIIKSREIASQKMFLIHNALGEDAKIFDSDEEPTASGLFSKMNQNPENEENISVETKIRNTYYEIKNNHPEVIEKVQNFPNRTKTAKLHTIDNTVIVRKKGLALFYILDKLNQDKHQTVEITLEELISNIECKIEEPKVPLDKSFWESYEIIKKYIPKHRSGAGNIKSLEQKAITALKDLLKNHKELLNHQQIEFVNTLIYDIRKYKTLPDYTLRRLSLSGKKDEHETLVENIKDINARLKNNYLDKIRERISMIKDDVIIAVRNK